MSHSLADIANLSILYSQPGRFYHNLNHINWCLGELEEFAAATKMHIEDRKLVEYAIWWHDAVYNPYSKRNEIESANLFVGEVDSNKHSPSFCHTVEEMILATAHHTEDQEAIPFLTQVLLDIDLAGLGYSYDNYCTNGDNIRKEFAHVDNIRFFTARCDFLNKIMARKNIYYTNYFRTKYETQARNNMKIDINESEAKLRAYQSMAHNRAQ